MISLKQLNLFLTNLLHYDKKLDVSKIDPDNGNGMQIKGSDKIKRIGFGVTASEKLFRLGKKADCDALIVHHGIRWPDTPHFNLAIQKRISYLIKNNISLFSYHFLLDSHPEVGNNSQILKLLRTNNLKQYEILGSNWGWYGKFHKTKGLSLVIKKCESIFKQKVKLYKYGNEKIKTVAAVSGGGSPKGKDLQNVIDRNIDLYITGEAKEGTREMFREIGVNFLAGGHYATETFGVKALMNKVKEEFKTKVKADYIELWNEV